jgi:hypothetical protein
MEEEVIFFVNERQPLVFKMKGKLQIKDDPKVFLNGRLPHILYFCVNGRQPPFFKWNTTTKIVN